jgi:hypothetical protein
LAFDVLSRDRAKVPSPTWRSFLHTHLTDIAAIDMFVVATTTFQLLYALTLGNMRANGVRSLLFGASGAAAITKLF